MKSRLARYAVTAVAVVAAFAVGRAGWRGEAKEEATNRAPPGPVDLQPLPATAPTSEVRRNGPAAPATSRSSASPEEATVGAAARKQPSGSDHVRDAALAVHAGELRDTTWARGAERLATASIERGLGNLGRVTSVDCRSTVCKIEVARDGVAGEEALRNALLSPASRPWNGPGLILGGGPGENASTVLLYREGVVPNFD